MCSSDLFLGIIAILFPPLPGKSKSIQSRRSPSSHYSSLTICLHQYHSLHLRINLTILVWVKRGICSADSLINILLCVLGFIPGLLHAWYIIAKFPDPGYEYDSLQDDYEGGRVRYIVIDRHGPNPPKPSAQAQPNYGTASHQQQHGEGSSGDHSVPPSYADVVAGDHKVQSNH